MSRMLYKITSGNALFNGTDNITNMRKEPDRYRYEGDDREKSLDLARKYSDDVIEIYKNGISREVYQWSALELNDCDEIVGYEVKIFDPLDRFKKIKKFAELAHSGKCDIISYIVGDCEWMGDFMRGDRVCGLYRYTDTALGDFTAYEEEGALWLPENFSDYAILNPDELMLAMDEGVTFWQDWETDDPEARLLYKIFQNY